MISMGKKIGLLNDLIYHVSFLSASAYSIVDVKCI